MDQLNNAIDNDLNPPENALEDASEGQDGQKRSLRGAINAMCRNCIYDDTPRANLGTWREQTEACTVTKCPLYAVRPVSRPRKGV